MAHRYSPEALLHFRKSPLCVRPIKLPSIQDWLSDPLDQTRSQTRAPSDRSLATEDLLLEPSSRRPPFDRNSPRNSSRGVLDHSDVGFGQNRTSFSSPRNQKSLDNDRTARDSKGCSRNTVRSRSGEIESFRDSKTFALGRGDGEIDGGGWNTVKPRKSFGAENAERFQGKMSASPRDERRGLKDREDRDAARGRSSKDLDNLMREKDSSANDLRQRNAPGRSKQDTWRSGDVKESAPTERRERDRNKSWRERSRETEPPMDRGNTRTVDKRWGRDRDREPKNAERDPEWADDPTVDQREAHTQQDFQKWMEQMKANRSSTPAANKSPRSSMLATNDSKDMSTHAKAPAARGSKPVASPSVTEAGPDKFFLAFGSDANLDLTRSLDQNENGPRARPQGKTSRFTSFFSQAPQEGRMRAEQVGPSPGPGIGNSHTATGFSASYPAAASTSTTGGVATSSSAPDERHAFQQLLAKLQNQSLNPVPSASSPMPAPPQGSTPIPTVFPSALRPPEAFEPHLCNGHESFGIGRISQHAQEADDPGAQKQISLYGASAQDPTGLQRQEMSPQGNPNRLGGAAKDMSNTEFLMNLMRAAPDGSRAENQPWMQQASMQQMESGSMRPLAQRDASFPREKRNSQGPMLPPGFPPSEPTHLKADGGPRLMDRPPQLLQHLPPAPPGLDQMPPDWMTRGGPHQRGSMMPPPGLAGSGGRQVVLPPMLPPNFPMASMPPPPPPPDSAMGMPPRNVPMPPPGFMGGPLHGFAPPALTRFNGPPVPNPQGFGSPFEGMGLSSPANRGTSFGRP